MYIFYQFLLSFCATSGFALYFNAPLGTIIPSGLAGGLSWTLFYLISTYLRQNIIGAFLAAFLVGVLGEKLAIKLKKPATVFITPGIVPLVPGAGMYYTMFYLVEKDFVQAASRGTETFFLAASIAVGIISSTIFSRAIRSFRKKY